MRFAIVHDWFNNLGGAEKVVKEILYCFPDADVFCLFDFFSPDNRKTYLDNKKTKKSFIQYLPFARRYYRLYFPLFPMAIELLDLKDYDVIISSSSCVAKGVRTNKNQLHICYCHSPARYAWDLKDEYLNEIKYLIPRKIIGFFLGLLRSWDFRRSQGVDFFLANSDNVRCRILKHYQRDAYVIYPPVDIDKFEICEEKENYYFAVNRLVSYKRTELLLKAFQQLPDLKLEIAGDGPEKTKLEKMASENVRFLGFLDDKALIQKMKYAKAFVAVAHEDFGITVVEAQASGTPVIVPRIGGYRETVIDETGVFIESRTVENIIKAFKEFDGKKNGYNKASFVGNVSRFHRTRFHQALKEFVDDKCRNSSSGKQAVQ
jgi:glycosyltransferase involved in cell wall biosynthesis